MFVAFEGIDGSGKTTISNRAADRLRQLGHTVEHARAGGRFRSNVTQNIRELARDARNLALGPRAEFFLYVARDAQLIDEVVRPALSSADLVIGDRSLSSALVLAHHGRGLPLDELRPALAAAAAGLDPELVVLIDVDPHLARARRRTSKILTPDGLPSSRKGLTGTGLQHRLRAGYLELAAAEPERWITVSNSDRPLDEVVDDVVELLSLAIAQGPAAAVDEARRRCLDRPLAPSPALAGPEDALQRYVEWLGRRAALEPDVAAYFLGGIAGPSVDDLRIALAEVSPRMVAHALAGLVDEVSWMLRRRLHEAAPAAVARSLSGRAGDTEEAWVMRAALASRAADAVAASLEHLDGPQAMALRTSLLEEAPAEVAESLAGIDTAEAWSLRERALALLGASTTELNSYIAARAAALSVIGLGDERAWALRKRARREAPAAALLSLRGLQDERAWRWRARFLDAAPKPVMWSLSGLDHPAAWEMRERALPTCREVLESMWGIDHPTAWRLRELALDVWPSTVLKSLGQLVAGPRGRGIVARELRRYPHNISVLKHAAAIALKLHTEDVLAA